jgi:hypothetical protein
LVRAHPRHHRIIMDAGVVHEDLDRTRDQNPLDRRGRLRRLGDVEAQRLGPAAMGQDFSGEHLRALQLAIGVQVDMVTSRREMGGNGGADAAARAGDEGALHAGASNRTVARPLSHSSSPAMTVKA